MSLLDQYGFKPHGASEGTTTVDKEKTVSCKVDPTVWARWRRVHDRLSRVGEVTLTGVVRSSFLRALDDLEKSADEYEAGGAAGDPVPARGGKAK